MKKSGFLTLLIFSLPGLAFSFFLGFFIKDFDNNLCYSYAIGDISEKLEKVISQESWEEVRKFQQELNRLPLHGYESNCEEIKRAVEKL